MKKIINNNTGSNTTFLEGTKTIYDKDGNVYVPSFVTVRGFIGAEKIIEGKDGSFSQKSICLNNRAKTLEYLLSAEENSLSVDDRENIWLNIVASKAMGEKTRTHFTEHLTKGCDVLFCGTLSVREYEGKDYFTLYVKSYSKIRNAKDSVNDIEKTDEINEVETDGLQPVIDDSAIPF